MKVCCHIIKYQSIEPFELEIKLNPDISGSEGSRPLGEVEVMRLSSDEDYYQPASWCLTNLSSPDSQSFLARDGAAAVLVDSLEFSGVTNISLHHQHLLQAVLLCGGADSQFQAQWRPLIGPDPSRYCARIGWIISTDESPVSLWIWPNESSPLWLPGV